MTAVDQFQVQTEALAADTERAVLAIYAAFVSGQLIREAAVQLIVVAVNRANAAAVSLADVFLALQIEGLTGQPVPTIGIPPTDHSERLGKAVETILDDVDEQDDDVDDEQASTRLTRLARAEPLETAQTATSEAMQKQELVEGWVRQFDADPCQLCQWWWREGRVWPKAHPFQTHKGCNCAARIVLAEHIESTGFTRQLERNSAA